MDQQEYQKEYRKKNKENRKKYLKDNFEKLKLQKDEWRNKNKEKIKIQVKEYGKKYREENKELLRQRKKEYYIKNKEKILERQKILNKEKYKNDIIYHLKISIRSLIRQSIKNNGYKKSMRTTEILGCTIEEFKIHLENKFEEWMNFDNHGKYNGEYKFGWDIDHIIELKTAKTEQDLLKLNHYTNLRPLDSKINRIDRNG